ncbi:MAG: hypothetical protein ABFD64_11915 [Armatimonadota bacterium]
MTATDIAAYIGAAAWLPPIAYGIYRWLTKPIVQIAPEMQFELGFTNLGPIFNIRLALSASKMDTIIDRIWVELHHEGGDTHRLAWTGMRETFSEITDSAGNKQRVEKDQPAIALKLATPLLTEKIIRFQDLDFHSRLRPILGALIEHEAYLKSQNDDYQQIIMASAQMFKFLEFYRSSFWWKTGKYIIQFVIESRDNAILKKEAFSFELEQYDVDALQQNVNLVKVNIENAVKSSQPDFEPYNVSWAWRIIPLVKSEDSQSA